MRERKIADAISQFKAVMKKDPNNPLAIYNLALAYIQSNEKKQASDMLNKIITLDYFAPIKEMAKKLIKNIDSTSTAFE
jgi:predicted Zn-dependent protease